MTTSTPRPTFSAHMDHPELRLKDPQLLAWWAAEAALYLHDQGATYHEIARAIHNALSEALTNYTPLPHTYDTSIPGEKS